MHMCSIYVFAHCFCVIVIYSQVIASLLCYTADLTLVELCFIHSLCMQLTVFSNLASHHTHTNTHTIPPTHTTHSFSLKHITPTCDISEHMMRESPLFLCFARHARVHAHTHACVHAHTHTRTQTGPFNIVQQWPLLCKQAVFVFCFLLFWL